MYNDVSHAESQNLKTVGCVVPAEMFFARIKWDNTNINGPQTINMVVSVVNIFDLS